MWLQGEGWLPAGEVEPGHILASLNGDVAVYLTELHESPTSVYNFSVGQTPNYFAGEMKLWVHNVKYHDCSKLNGNSGKLRDRLTDDPHFGKKNFQAHHILPSAIIKDARYSKLLEAARDAGYDINGSRNGILLPDNDGLAAEVGLPRHRGSHSKYTDYVKSQLEQIRNKYRRQLESGNINEATQQRIKADIEKIQGTIKAKIRAGVIGIADSEWN